LNPMPFERVPMIALANTLLLIGGTAARADEIEAPGRVLLADMFAATAPLEEDELERFTTSFGIRKGRGFQLVRPIEFNEEKYEFNLSGPIVKSGTKKKSFGLSFELRF
jgi:hypothetical protein